MTRRILYAALLALLVLHNDFWLWSEGTMLAGLPVGLTYHLAYTLLTAIVLALLVRHAWPDDLEAAGDEPR